MKLKVLAGSTMALGLMGVGVLVGSIAGAGNTSAQTSASTAPVQLASSNGAYNSSIEASVGTYRGSFAQTQPGTTAPGTTAPGTGTGTTTAAPKITQQQAEQAALAA